MMKNKLLVTFMALLMAGLSSSVIAQYSQSTATQSYVTDNAETFYFSFNTSTATQATSNGTLTVYYRGDYGVAGEDLDVYNNEAGNLYGSTPVLGSDCNNTYATYTITIPQAELNALIADGTANFRLEKDASVDFICTYHDMYLSLAYSTPVYCASNATSSADSEIDSVALIGDIGSIANGSAGVCATYTDYTSVSTPNLTVGSSYTTSVTVGTCGGNYNKYVNVYIDWNEDGDFADANEAMVQQGPVGTTGTRNFNFTVPSVAQGTKRMRVICSETSPVSACGTYDWGETEDYQFNVWESCPSYANNLDDSRVDNVVLNGNTTSISNNSTAAGCRQYSNYMGLTPADLTAGSNYSVAVTLGTCNGNYNKYGNVYFDWNQDGDFSDANEALTQQGPLGTTGTLTFNFTVPTTVATGNVPMRVVCSEATPVISCGIYDWGETEDYLVSVTGIPPCLTTISSFPYNEDFESFGLCSDAAGAACTLNNGWTNETSDDIDWTTWQGGTSSTNTGPGQATGSPTDYNPGTSTGNYLYTEASVSGTGFPNREAIATSPCFNLSSVSNTELRFAYNMYGATMGTLYVDVSTDNGLTWSNMWLLSGNQGDVWTQATVDLSAYDGQTIRIRFRGVTGSDYGSDIAIDDINVGSACTVSLPTASGNSRCGTGSVSLSATPGAGGTICRWYTAASGGTLLATSNTYNTPSIATTTTYYVSTYSASCESGRVAVTATVNSIPTVNITNVSSSYCINASSFTMTATPAGGTFSGTGVSGSTFNPTSAGAGTHNITYSYTDGNGCSNSDVVSVTVNTLPTVSSAGLSSTYCTSDGAATLTGTPAGGSFSGPGVSGSSFNPATAGAGTHTITYTYTNGNGCSNTSTQSTTVTAPPTISFSGLNSSYCVNASSVSLSGSPSGGTFSGNGVTGNTFNPATAGTGTHTITYSYTNGSGCSNTSTQTVTVNALPTLSINNLNGAYCLTSGTATMTGSPSGGTFSGTGVSGNTFDPAAAGLGSHTVTYVYTNGNGCTGTLSQTVDVINNPTASITMNSTYCTSDAAFTVNVSPTGGTLSGPGTNGTTFDPAVAGAGTHQIIYNFSAGTGCSDADTVMVTVNSAPTGVSFSGLSGTICSADAAIALTGTPAGGTFSGTGVTGSSFDPSTAGAGTHDVTYTYSNGTCSTSTTQSVTVQQAPTPTFSGLSVSGYCETDGDATLTGTPAGGTFSGTGVTGNTFSPSTAGAGTYTITYNYTDGSGCTGSASQQVTVTTAGTPTSNFTTSVSTFTANFSDLSTNASSWSWDFGDGTGTSTSQNPSYTYATHGVYNVCLSVLNACGGSDITCKNVTIANPNPDGMEELSENLISLYPNPTRGQVTVTLTSMGTHEVSMEIVDILGKSVRQFRNQKFTDDMTLTFDMSQENSGVYFLRVLVDDQLMLKKIVVEK